MQAIIKCVRVILDLLFPKRCVGCDREGSYFCRDCTGDILQTELVCPQCERPAVGGLTHPLCLRRYGLNGLWSLGIYQDSLKKAIQQLKYRHVEGLARDLTDIVLEYWAKYQPLVLDIIKKDQGVGWAVVPVPLHWFRQNWRGFNQSSLFAKQLADSLGLKYGEILMKSRYTKPQAKLKSYDRRENIKNVFALSPHYQLRTNPYILLVDDVWTTGSTLKECCYVLKKAGAKQVWALTLAR